ncbi:MAG TPA: hypothetical protein VH062_29230 [Polyangiaceae bacterium]|nr:hypothetical protein [Polyangiaceae bacterium]
MNGLRFLGVLAVALGFSGLLGASGCSQTYSCVGDFTGTCSDLDATECTSVRGCKTVKAVCLNGCDVPGSTCDPNTCSGSATSCSSPCNAMNDEPSCNQLTASLGSALSLHVCTWTSDGCLSVCPSQKSDTACKAQGAAGCSWIECEGAPKDDCSAYSGDTCPVSLGCDRTSQPVPSSN